MSEKRTDIKDLCEFGLIDTLTKNFTTHVSTTLKGVGDDAAVISISETQAMLVSTDMLVEGIHFNLMYTPLMHLGYKSVVVNLSDIYAMNGKPTQITVSFAVSSRFPLEALEELYAGIKKACDFYQVDLVGGDTTSSLSGLVISITALGTANKKDIVYRGGAKEYDLVVVSGDLGGAYMGLQLLEREREVFKANPNIQPDLDGHDYLLERQLKPEARQDVIAFLKDAKTSMAAIEFNIDPITAALNGGEDYELLFTVKQEDYEKVAANPNFTVIGHITDHASGLNLVDKHGAVVPMQAQGWNHFE